LRNGVAQLLYATQLSINYLNVKLAGENPEKFNESKAYTTTLLSDSIKETRRISHELMPTVLAGFGLEAAIRDICNQLLTAYDFIARYHLDLLS
jgi:signal transduction histidine kinase